MGGHSWIIVNSSGIGIADSSFFVGVAALTVVCACSVRGFVYCVYPVQILLNLLCHLFLIASFGFPYKNSPRPFLGQCHGSLLKIAQHSCDVLTMTLFCFHLVNQMSLPV